MKALFKNKKLNKIILIPLIILTFGFSYILVNFYSALGSYPKKQDKRRYESSRQFDPKKGKFFNTDKIAYGNMIKRIMKSGGKLRYFFGGGNHREPLKGLPVLKPNLAEFLVKSDEIKVIWFGHSTFMLNLRGTIILVDPILSPYSSPLMFTVKRFQEPPLSMDELPHIDYILISHDHYDHLDMPTIKYFQEKDTKFMVPLGVGAHLKGWGIEGSRITEFDWWQEKSFNGLKIVCTPAQHFSGRSYYDKNSTLWSSWIIEDGLHRIYFSGDSGYNSHFKKIGDKYGPFDVAFLENGQYAKAWKEAHLMPGEGVDAFYDLKAKVYFPVHWGAFKLSLHPWYEPIQIMYKYAMDRHFPIIAPKIGEIVNIDENYQTKPWWREVMDPAVL